MLAGILPADALAALTSARHCLLGCPWLSARRRYYIRRSWFTAGYSETVKVTVW